MERNYCSVSFPIPRQPTKFLKNFSALNIIALQVIENMEARSHHSRISKRDSVQSFFITMYTHSILSGTQLKA